MGDGRYPEQWCANMQFDRILLLMSFAQQLALYRHPDKMAARRNEDSNSG